MYTIIMLTGGKTDRRLYKFWGNDIPWVHSKITNYFGDERCVPQDNSESNYGMSIASLFPQGVPTGCKID